MNAKDVNPLHILVSYYHSYFDNGEKEPKQVYLDEFLFSQEHLIKPTAKAIRTAEFIMLKSNSKLKGYSVREFMTKPLSEKLAIIRSTDDKAEKDKLKKLMPAVTPSAMFHSRRHKNSTEYTPTGFLVLDIDGVDVKEVKAKIALYSDKILYCGLSVSGKGLFIIIQIAHPEKHLQHFASAKASIESFIETKVDQLPDLTRLRGYAYDPDAFYNPAAGIYEGIIDIIDHDTINYGELPELEPTTAFDKPEYIEPIITIWVKKGYCVESDVYPSLFRIADLAAKFGLSEEFVLNYLYIKYKGCARVLSDSKYSYQYFAEAIKEGFTEYPHTHNKLRFGQFEQQEPKKNNVRVINKYLLEDKPFFFKQIDENRNIAFTAATGTGKTDICYLYTQQWLQTNISGRVVFCYPDNMSVEAKTVEYSHKENNFHGIELDIFSLNQFSSADELKFITHRQVINSSFASFHRIDFLTENDIVFIDEAHKGVIDNFEATENFFKNLSKCPAKKIYLTGTPFPEFYKEYGIKELVYDRFVKPKITVNCYEITDGKESYNFVQEHELYSKAVIEYIKTIDSSQLRIHPVFINNTETIKAIAEIIRKERVFDVHEIYSDEEIKRNCPIWKAITNTGHIPHGSKPLIVLSTSIMYQCISLLDINFGDFAIFGEQWTENNRQAIGRPRKMDKLTINYFLAVNQKKGFNKYYNTFRKSHQRDFERVKSIYQNLEQMETEPNIEKLKTMFAVDLARYIDEDGSYNRFDAVKSYYQERNIYESNLQKFNRLSAFFKVTLWGIIDVSTSAADEVKQGKQITKEQKETLTNQSFAGIRQNIMFCLMMLLQNKIQHDLRTDIKNYLGRYPLDFMDNVYLSFKNKFNRDHIPIFARIVSRYIYFMRYFKEGSALIELVERNFEDTPYGQLLQQLTIFDSQGNTSNYRIRINAEVFQKIRDSFVIGQIYSTKERDKIIRDIYKEFETEKIGKKTGYLFKQLFHVRECRVNLVRCLKILDIKTIESFANENSLAIPNSKKDNIVYTTVESGISQTLPIPNSTYSTGTQMPEDTPDWLLNRNSNEPCPF